jgi:Tol biopolymer transport system component
MKKQISLLLLSMCSVAGFSQKLDPPQKIPVRGMYSSPLVSPINQYALLTTPNFTGVYLLDMKTYKVTQISKVAGSGYGYSWSGDGETFYFKEKKDNDYVSNSVLKSYSVKTKKTEKLEELNHNYLPSFTGDLNDVVIYTNIHTLKIEAKDLKTNKSWVITPGEGQFYNAILSHDKTKIAVNKGADLYIYPIEGTDFPVKIGTGLATSWSKDSKYVIGFMDESEDGHNVSNSELYLFDTTKANPKKLTTTAKLFEMYPSFYDTNKIIFTDDKTGQLYTSKINF